MMNLLKTENSTGKTEEANASQRRPSSFASSLQHHAKACMEFAAGQFFAAGKQISPIGLDIGSHSIKMIQLAVANSQLVVTAAEKVLFDPAIDADPEQRRQFMISAINKMLAKGHYKGRNVVGCLTCDELKITSIRRDFSSIENIDELLTKEALQHFGFEAAADQIKYFIAGNVVHGDEVKSELILLAVESDAINSNIEIMEAAGLTPVAIDTVPCALFRCFTRILRRQEDNKAVNLFVDIGRKFTTLVISRGRDITFVKQIPLGGEKFDQEIATKLGIDNAEAALLRNRLKYDRIEKAADISNDQDKFDAATRQAMVDAMTPAISQLVREISLCIRYYAVTFRGERLRKAVLTGGEVYESTLINAMKRQLSMEIEIAEPLTGFDLTDTNLEAGKDELFAEWAVAVGLCLNGWTVPGDKEDNHERN